MSFYVKLQEQSYRVRMEEPQCLAIPLAFARSPADLPSPDQPLGCAIRQANLFDADRASAVTMQTGNFIGDVRKGGSCNAEVLTITSHCNGTHTECIGHLLHECVSIHECLQEAWLSACLISVEAQEALTTNESYALPWDKGDRIITRQSIEQALAKHSDFEPFLLNESNTPKALIVRTLPNPIEKQCWKYGNENMPPFFSNEAMRYLTDLGIQHILVDFPSVDKIYDGGTLSNHRIFWKLAPGQKTSENSAEWNKTITEMIYVPEQVNDGRYVLNLQIPAFLSDAAPSRPLIYPLELKHAL